MTVVIRVAPQAALDLPALRALALALDGAGGADGAGPPDILLLEDDFSSGQNAVTVAAWLAGQTTDLRIVPEVPLTHTEPFHVATSTATLDHVSRGRAGWSPTVQTDTTSAALVGRRPASPDGVWREFGDIVSAVRRLWTSWEPDAEIRDAATARFIDRDKVHYVDVEVTDSVGEVFTVKGPSIVPRPPQGELPTVVTVAEPASVTAAGEVAGEASGVLIVGDRFVTGDGGTGEVLRLADTADVLAAASRYSRATR